MVFDTINVIEVRQALAPPGFEFHANMAVADPDAEPAFVRITRMRKHRGSHNVFVCDTAYDCAGQPIEGSVAVYVRKEGSS